jgi:sugar/nucleoside kinase (ribokinase family)
MIYDLISIGSITKDIFLLTNRGKIFETPKDKLALEWLGFELGEKIFLDELVENVGGVATNLFIGTKRLGLKSTLLGPAKAPVSVIVVDRKSGERVIFYQKASGKIDLRALKNLKTKWLSVSSLTGNWRQETNDILAYTKKNNVKLVVAPSTSMIREGYHNLKKLLAQSEIIFLNRNEATEIAAKSDNKSRNSKYLPKYLLKYLHSLGSKIVCLTDGTRGAYCSNGEKIYHSPIQKVKTVDVTGAGDAFTSGFLGIYIKGGSIEKSLKMGIQNSANVVRYVGTTKGLLNKREIKRILK